MPDVDDNSSRQSDVWAVCRMRVACSCDLDHAQGPEESIPVSTNDIESRQLNLTEYHEWLRLYLSERLGKLKESNPSEYTHQMACVSGLFSGSVMRLVAT